MDFERRESDVKSFRVVHQVFQEILSGEERIVPEWCDRYSCWEMNSTGEEVSAAVTRRVRSTPRMVIDY